MRTLFTVFVLSVCIIRIAAQEAPMLKWVATEYVKDMSVKGPNIRSDAQGNIFSISTQTHLNPLVGFILIKYDPDGNKLWERNYEGLLPHLYYGPAIDPDGNAYVSINYGGLPGLPTYTILLKYAPDGTLVWEKSFEDWANNVTNLLAAGPQGHLYFSGGVSNTNITQGYFVGCMDTSDGSVLWKTELNEPINPYNMKLLGDKIVLFANGLAMPNSSTRYHVVQQFGYDGGLLATGLSVDSSIYGPDFNNITDSGEVLIGNRFGGYEATKISVEGEILWFYYFSSLLGGSVYGLAADDSLYTYVTGGLNADGLSLDLLTAKLSPNGDVVWENYYFTDEDSLSGAGNNIMVDSKFVYVVGGSAKDSSFVNGIIVLLIIDKLSGVTLYDLTVTTDSSDNGYDIVLLHNGFAFCGNSNGSSSGTVKLITGYFKFSTALSSEEASTEKTDPFLLYPNPASSTVYVQLSKRADLNSTAAVYDLNGRLLMESPFNGKDKIGMDVSQLPAGMYVMKVGNQGLKFSKP